MEKKKVLVCKLDENENFGVHAISFVDEPAIMQDFIYLAAQKIKLSEVSEDKRMVFGPVLIPDLKILRLDKTTNEEYFMVFEADTIERTSQLYLEKNQQHNHTLQHELALNGCTVVQSWLKEYKEDKSNAMGFDLPVGTWFVGVKVNNDDVWNEIKEGRVKGFSVEAFYDMVSLSMSKYDEEHLLKELENALLN